MRPINRNLINGQWPSRMIIWGRGAVVTLIATFVMAAFIGTAFAQGAGPGEAKQALPENLLQEPQEQVTLTKLPPPDARRVYITDARAFDVLTQNMVINGDTGKYGGTITTGLLPVPAILPDRSKLYIADTHFSDYDTGKRNDLIRIYDPRTLTQTGEIDIPESRFFGMSQPSYTQISPDGNYLLFYQFVPTNGVGIVDLKSGKYLDSLNTPQCFYVFPTTNRRVVMHCRDGSLLQVSFDQNGKEVEKSKTKPFHDPVKEPTFNEPAFSDSTGKIFFVSFWGKAFPVDISGAQPKIGKQWDLITEKERKEGWLPGGWQTAAYQPKTNRLYVLMDHRAKWTQNTESNYVWVYDAATGKKVHEIHLAHPARAIYVDQGSPPYLYALSTHHQNLTIYDAKSGAITAFIDELGVEPLLIVGGT